MSAYYNDNDPKACAWLRELAREGHITDGRVDERSIADVRADELSGFTRAHFFAGIGGWDYALRLAGWPDDVPVWTGSCPCQPFSAAGKGLGTSDHRHLWPELRRLIAERRPPVVFGEQVASRAGRDWLAAVRADLEALGYAVGAADLCAAGAGAPHIRQRLYFVAYRGGEGRGQVGADIRGRAERSGPQGVDERPLHGGAIGVAYRDGSRCRTRRSGEASARGDEARIELAGLRAAGDVGDADEQGPQGQWGVGTEHDKGEWARAQRYGSSSSVWCQCEWIACRDGKRRPVEPGTFPLAHGVPARVGRLRGYGNAIVPQVAAAFVTAFMDVFFQEER